MKYLLYILAIYLVLYSSASGAILLMNSFVTKFEPDSPSLENVTWEPKDKFDITKDGFGWNEEPAAHRGVKFRFKPIAMGYAWRAPYGTNVIIKVTSDTTEYTLNSGQTSAPYPGSFYVRYSVNRRDWSSWISVPNSWKEDTEDWHYKISLDIPDINKTEYHKYYETYRKLDVPWVDDQDALARWIIEQDQDFFSKHIPFMGWIEVLYEDSIGGSRRLKEIKIDTGIGMGGMHMPPKDPKNPKYHSHEPWKFYQEEKRQQDDEEQRF